MEIEVSNNDYSTHLYGVTTTGKSLLIVALRDGTIMIFIPYGKQQRKENLRNVLKVTQLVHGRTRM